MPTNAPQPEPIEVPDYDGPTGTAHLDRVVDTRHGKFSLVGPPLHEPDLAAFEDEFALRVPHEYRALLAAANSGLFERDCLAFHTPVGPSMEQFHLLYGLGLPYEYPDLLGWNRRLRRHLPEGWIAIAITASESQIILGCRGDTRGQLRVWLLHPSDATDQRHFHAADDLAQFFRLFAPNFTDALERLEREFPNPA